MDEYQATRFATDLSNDNCRNNSLKWVEEVSTQKLEDWDVLAQNYAILPPLIHLLASSASRTADIRKVLQVLNNISVDRGNCESLFRVEPPILAVLPIPLRSEDRRTRMLACELVLAMSAITEYQLLMTSPEYELFSSLIIIIAQQTDSSRKFALNALENLAIDDNNKVFFASADVGLLPVLVDIMGADRSEARISVCSIISLLSLLPENHAAITDPNLCILDALVMVLRDDTDAALVLACTILGNISSNDEYNLVMTDPELHLLDAITEVISSGNIEARWRACTVLANLSINDENKRLMASPHLGLLDVLRAEASITRGGDGEGRTSACATLAQVAALECNAAACLKANLWALMISIIQCAGSDPQVWGASPVGHAAMWALQFCLHMSQWPVAWESMLTRGLVPTLQSLVEHNNRQSLVALLTLASLWAGVETMPSLTIPESSTVPADMRNLRETMKSVNLRRVVGIFFNASIQKGTSLYRHDFFSLLVIIRICCRLSRVSHKCARLMAMFKAGLACHYILERYYLGSLSDLERPCVDFAIQILHRISTAHRKEEFTPSVLLPGRTELIGDLLNQLNYLRHLEIPTDCPEMLTEEGQRCILVLLRRIGKDEDETDKKGEKHNKNVTNMNLESPMSAPADDSSEYKFELLDDEEDEMFGSNGKDESQMNMDMSTHSSVGTFLTHTSQGDLASTSRSKPKSKQRKKKKGVPKDTSNESISGLASIETSITTISSAVKAGSQQWSPPEEDVPFKDINTIPKMSVKQQEAVQVVQYQPELPRAIPDPPSSTSVVRGEVMERSNSYSTAVTAVSPKVILKNIRNSKSAPLRSYAKPKSTTDVIRNSAEITNPTEPSRMSNRGDRNSEKNSWSQGVSKYSDNDSISTNKRECDGRSADTLGIGWPATRSLKSGRPESRSRADGLLQAALDAQAKRAVNANTENTEEPELMPSVDGYGNGNSNGNGSPPYSETTSETTSRRAPISLFSPKAFTNAHELHKRVLQQSMRADDLDRFTLLEFEEDSVSTSTIRPTQRTPGTEGAGLRPSTPASANSSCSNGSNDNSKVRFSGEPEDLAELGSVHSSKSRDVAGNTYGNPSASASASAHVSPPASSESASVAGEGSTAEARVLAKFNALLSGGISGCLPMRVLAKGGDSSSTKSLTAGLSGATCPSSMSAMLSSGKPTNADGQNGSICGPVGKTNGYLAEVAKTGNEHAWRLLRDPLKVRNHAGLAVLLKELGLSQAAELQFCTAKDLEQLSDTLKDVPRRMFRSLYGL